MEFELSSMTSALKSDKKTETKAADVTQHYKQVESEIKYESQKVKDVIDIKENKLLDYLKLITSKELGNLKVSIETGEMAIQMYEHQLALIDQAVKYDSEIDIYERYKSCEFGETELANDTNTDTKNKRTVDRISLRRNTDKLIETLSGLQLGEIDITYEDEMSLKSALVLRDTVRVRVPGDKTAADPTDMIVLDVNGTNTIVVADWNNRSLKYFYMRNNQPCHSRLSLDGTPWSLTLLKHHQVAVSVPESKQIVAVEVSPDLKQLSTICTEKDYWCITAVTPSILAAGSHGHPSVDILDMTGTVIRPLTPNIRIQCPEFLCTTAKNNILVSDSLSKSVLCLTPEGDVVFSYSPGSTELHSPRGITVTNTGDILLADFRLHSVLHLTESGQFVRNILTSQDGLNYPHGLHVDNRGRLYVCLFYYGEFKVFSN